MKKQKLGMLTAALFFAFVAAFAIHGNLQGKAVSNSFLPHKKSDAAEATAKPDTVLTAQTLNLYKGERIAFERLKPMPPQLIDSETLWLARCIFSETKRREEQELVAWVVRNRVETAYRGKQTYRDAVLDPYQFSAFNPGTRTRRYYTALTPQSKTPGWQTALTIAHNVRHADVKYRPFQPKTRHFYSEQSMVGQKHPNWARGLSPITPARDHEVSPDRFRFYAGVY